MSGTEEWLHNHQILQAKFALPEEWLQFIRAASLAIRNTSVARARHLRPHTEEEVIATGRRREEPAAA